MRIRVSSKGRIVLPAEIRRRDQVEAGQEFEGRSRPNQGLVDWLLDCPEKGYFVPIKSESTDSL